MEAILDFSTPFNASLFDEIITIFYTSQHPQQTQAGEILYRFKENDRAWSVADAIIEQCTNPRSVFFGLILLEEMIQNRWSVVPSPQRESIKNYALGKVMAYSETMESVESNENILHKWDIILVEIFKKEWPNNWTSFVQDLVSSATESESRCRNCMFILKTVVEDVFQFNETTLTSTFSREIQNALLNDIIQIFMLCKQVLFNTEVISLLLDTIDTLRLILKYLPDEYVFDYTVVEVLQKCIEVDQFRTSAMMCLQEIICHPRSAKYPSLVSHALTHFIQYMLSFFNISTDLSTAYSSLSPALTEFVHQFTLFLTSATSQHKVMLQREFQSLYLQICAYVLCVSRCPDREVLKLCMEFWREWARDIADVYGHGKPARLAAPPKEPEGPFTPIVQQVIQLITERIPRPEEVMVMENEDGEIVRVETRDTDGIALYKVMRECLVMLVKTDYEIAEAILMNGLDIQMQLKPTDPFRHTLQPLVWTIGAVSGVLADKDERRLVIATIIDILRLVATKQTKDDKAVVAGCLMYVIQQYPKFLKQHYKFLQTVINKNFEFMHEPHPGVQDMACDTFRKVAKQCGQQLVISQTIDGKQYMPYINDIIAKLGVFVELLSQQQREVVYEGVASICRFEQSAEGRLSLIDNLLLSVNDQIAAVIKEGCVNAQAFHQMEAIHLLRNSLRLHRIVCEVVKIDYYKQFMNYYQDFADLFTLYSSTTIQAIKERGEVYAGYTQSRQERLLLRDIIRLFMCFIENMKDGRIGNGERINVKEVCEKIVGLLLQDYENAQECLKEPFVLQFAAAIVEKLKGESQSLIPSILSSLFLSTLHIVTANRLRYPELTLAFFTLLASLARYAFQALFSFPATERKLIIDSIIWGYLDSERRIYEDSLQTMIVVIDSVRACDSAFRQEFYSQFLVYIIQHTFDCLTDRMHIPVLPQLSRLLRLLFGILTGSEVTVPLIPSASTCFQNSAEVGNHLVKYLAEKFPQCSPNLIFEYVLALENANHMTDQEYKVVNRDFLIRLKEVTNDTVDLFADEKEAAQKQAEAGSM